MTPLAHRLARYLLDPRAKMLADIRAAAVRALDGAHFFDVTEAAAIGNEVARAIDKTTGGGRDVFIPCTFLPALVTWVEWRCPDPSWRTAVSLRMDSSRACVTAVCGDKGGIYLHEIGALDLQTGTRITYGKYLSDFPKNREWADGILVDTLIYLAIINSPRIVGRRTHTPHKGLMRELRQSPGVGIGPLLPWHEIKLQIAKPADIEDGAPHQDQITGRRALHFVRKFMRIRLGRLEYVSAHWRGDPALGIHQSDYRVGV